MASIMRPYVISQLLCSAVAAFADPHMTIPNEPIPTAKVITPALLSRMTLASQYSAAAYCPDNNNSPGTTITCDPGQACPLISSSPNITSIHEFENLGEAGMTGVIILDHTHRTIALAFRGSSSTSNWRACFLVEPVPWEDLCRGCRVHAGFRNAWDAARVQAEFWLRRAVREHPDYLLVIAGHSFGGAVAMLAAADLRRQRELGKALLFTFGPPRVGNAELARYLEGSGGNFRFTHGADPVPHLPLDVEKKGWFYANSYPEYHIRGSEAKNGTLAEVGVGDIVVCETPCTGKDGEWSLSAYLEHNQYFVHVAACGPHSGEAKIEGLILLSKYMKEYGEGLDKKLGKGTDLKNLKLATEELLPPH